MLENNENSINYVWRLINQQNLIGSLGRTTFSMSNLSIVVTTKDIIGNIIQEWFSKWMQDQGIEVHGGPHTQS